MMMSRSLFLLVGVMAVIAVMIPVTTYASQHTQLSFIEFENIGQYIAFENRMKNHLDMPIISVNYLTGEPEPTKQVTTDYTLPIFHEDKSDLRVIAIFDDNASTAGHVISGLESVKGKGWQFSEDP